MTQVTLTDEQLDRLADRLAARLADRLAEREAPRGLRRRVSAGELAVMLGVSRDTVYQHAAELGALHVGNGKRPRLRFDVEEALAAWSARQSSKRSQPSDAPADAGRPARRRRRAPGSDLDLLPIRGRKTPPMITP